MTGVLGAPIADIEDSPIGDYELRCNAANRTSTTSVDTPSPTPEHTWVFAIGAVVIAASGWAGSLLAMPSATHLELAAPPGIEGFAEMYVATVLAGGGDREHDLAPFVVAHPSWAAHGTTREVLRAGAIAVRSIGPRYWVVTVAAEVGNRGGGSNGRSAIEFYQVAVAEGDALVATGPPLPIPAPAPNAAHAIHHDLRTPADAHTAAFMSGFLEAYLIDGRRLPRFVTPDSGITPVTTLPVAAVKVLEVTVDADSTWATAVAVATTTEGTELAITATTRLVTRHGEYRIAELLPGPPPIAATE